MLVDAARSTPLFQQEQSIGYIDASQAAMATLQTEAASGNQVNAPSDNPTSIAQILSGQSLEVQTNVADGLAYSGSANGALTQANGIVSQAMATLVAVSTAQSVGSPTALQALANQMTGLFNQMVNLANTSYNGQSVFGGSAGPVAAYDANGNWQPTSNGSVPTRTISPGPPPITQAVSVPGNTTFGSSGSAAIPPLVSPGAPSATSYGVLGIMAQAIWDITNNPGAAANADQTNLQTAIKSMADSTAQVGSYYQVFQAAQSQLQTTLTVIQGQVSNLLNANMAQVTTQLTSAQNTFQESLWATGKVLQNPSLAQFLA